MFVHIVDLRGFHDITDDKEFCTEFVSYIYELIELTCSDECTIVWCVFFLDALDDRDSAIGRDE